MSMSCVLSHSGLRVKTSGSGLKIVTVGTPQENMPPDTFEPTRLNRKEFLQALRCAGACPTAADFEEVCWALSFGDINSIHIFIYIYMYMFFICCFFRGLGDRLEL